MLTHTQITARLDLDHIQRAARSAAVSIRNGGHAALRLTPGDGTVYPIIVLSKHMHWWTAEDQPAPRPEYWVTLASNFGETYPWAGATLHPDYVTKKWSRDGNLWTGAVMTEFLNALSEQLAQP